MRITKQVRVSAGLLCFFFLLTGLFSLRVHAANLTDYGPGTYQIQASLSCYVPAMGGCEFGGPLLKSAELNVDGNGNATMTLHLGKGQVTIYSITCDTFVDPNPGYVTDDRGVTSGTIGYYDQSGNLVTNGVTYTTSSDTALNPSNEQVHYVDSITFPVTYQSDTYALTMYINSNVMGVQFCQPNSAATSTTYQATLTVYWDGSEPAAAESAASAEVSGEEMDGLTLYTAEDNVGQDADSAADNGETTESDNMSGSETGTADSGTNTDGMMSTEDSDEEDSVFRTKEADDAADGETKDEQETGEIGIGTVSEIAASGSTENADEPWVYSGANHTLLIVLVIVGGVLVCFGGTSLAINLVTARKKAKEQDSNEK